MRKRVFLSSILIISVCLIWGGILVGGQIRFTRVTLPDGFKITAELAVTDEQRQQGLMYRQGMKEDQGMLFIFEVEDFYSFWMKNMLFSLDLLWLDSNRQIVHIEENIPPCASDPCPSYEPARPARYVLELVSGSVKKHGLKLGDRLDFLLPSEKKKLWEIRGY